MTIICSNIYLSINYPLPLVVCPLSFVPCRLPLVACRLPLATSRLPLPACLFPLASSRLPHSVMNDVDANFIILIVVVMITVFIYWRVCVKCYSVEEMDIYHSPHEGVASNHDRLRHTLDGPSIYDESQLTCVHAVHTVPVDVVLVHAEVVDPLQHCIVVVSHPC